MRAGTFSIALLVVLAGTLACVNGPLRPTTIQLGKSLNSDNSVGAHTTTFSPRAVVASIAGCCAQTGQASRTAALRAAALPMA